MTLFMGGLMLVMDLTDCDWSDSGSDRIGSCIAIVAGALVTGIYLHHFKEEQIQLIQDQVNHLEKLSRIVDYTISEQAPADASFAREAAELECEDCSDVHCLLELWPMELTTEALFKRISTMKKKSLRYMKMRTLLVTGRL